MTRSARRLVALGACLASGCLGFHAGPLPGEPADATFARVQGARVRYVDEGEGAPVVLIHGFASSLETWDGVRPALVARGHRVLAMDLKGFGWTDRPEGDYSPDAQARLVLALMDARGIERAAVVAHSWGSSVALALALRAPERVSRIALYDAYVYAGQRNTFFQWADADGMGELLFAAFYDQRPDERIALAFFDASNLSQALVDEVERALDRPGTRAAALAAVRGMHLEQQQRRYPEIEAPVLLLWGREDRVSRLSYGERLANELADAELRVYPRCGHFPMIEAARPSLRDLIAFLAAGREEGREDAAAPAGPVLRDPAPAAPAVEPAAPPIEPSQPADVAPPSEGP